MSKTFWGLSLASAAAAFGLAAYPSFAQDPAVAPTPTPGQRVGNAVDRLRQGVRDTGATVRESMTNARAGVHAMTTQSRLYSRLHWDKALTNASIEVDVTKEGVAVVRGGVPTAKDKARALDLAKETVGITSVVDELIVSPTSTTVIQSTTPTSTTTTTIQKTTKP